MTVGDFTSEALIVPRLRGTDSVTVLQELSSLLRREKRVPELLPFYHAALNREFLVSTETEAGIAFPHARLPGLADLSFAFGRSDEPLAWGKGTGGRVRMVFLIAVPATDSARYILLISGLARLIRERSVIERLREAADAQEILALFSATPLRDAVPAAAFC